MNRTFITATGTGIGKTLLTEVLIRQLRRQKKSVRALKPLISGISDATLADSDTARILDALGDPVTPENIARVSPWRFEAPLSPDMAAIREGRSVDFLKLIDFCELPRAADHVLIEGVGGAFVPLNEGHVVADWIAELGIPTLLVCGSYLGTLSHTIATVAALATRRVTVSGIVISESEDSPVPLQETQASMARFTGPIPIVCLPRVASWTDAPDLTPLIA
ncbi:dethiobiotin synthase [Iodidimonas sp. SYSU 1G8]|uniref:dethiobiotin synthase n=1 Tax=Iodidimonas sp. SYSU 1G8 TaxID=3133967 RepID=UPI0031FE6347